MRDAAEARSCVGRRSLAGLCAAFLGIGSVVAAGGDDKPPGFKIATKRDSDTVTVAVEKDRTVFSVRSPVGIGQAIIERTDEKWPACVVLRLHLKGLESFQVTNGKVALEASVSSQADRPEPRLWKDGREDAPLDRRSPLWMEIRMVGGDGKPAKGVPLNDGYFELPLPAAFFAQNPNSITLKWIDFYRG
ncbi:MAG: hypothetical protein K8U03_10650 [Planctomycetia bacterium]|nr:hypothetical protein [Planctomycetia bacterium]